LPFPRSEFGGGVDMTRAEARDVLAGSEESLHGAAAVIIDYTQGGCYANPAYQDEVAELARAAGALWIADEVITGFGKSGGHWFNFQRGEARPDLVTMGKAMGGGIVPVAAVVLSKRVVELLEGSSWQNYSALRSTDMAAAATRAMISVVHEEGLVARAAELHTRIERRMRSIASNHSGVARIDGRGLHWWVDLGTEDWRDWRGAATEPTVADRVASRVLEAGALIATSGERDAVLTTFPLVISDEDVDRALDALDAGLAEADRVTE
jgi:4-aminobutyrate aminotransferase-like enzyme